jgi:hypothetical protein
MNNDRNIFSTPIEAPAAGAVDEQQSFDAMPAEAALVVRMEVPACTGFVDLSDSEWSAFMGLRSGASL